MTMSTDRRRAYIASLPEVYQLPGGWRLVRLDAVYGFEITDARGSFCGLVRHDIASFAAAMGGSVPMLGAYRRELEACVKRLQKLDPHSKLLLPARALLAEHEPPARRVDG